MALQTKINGSLVPGIVGEFSDGAPKIARAYMTYGTASELPAFGRFFSFGTETDAGNSETHIVAKMGIPDGAKQMGVLVNPKEHYVVGFTTARTLAKNGIPATIATQGHIWVMVESNVTAGDAVYVTAANGKLSATSSGNTPVKGAQWLSTVSADFASEYTAYDPTTTAGYEVGDKCKNGGKYYVCKTAIASGSAAGAFDATKWTEVFPITEALAEVAIDNPGLEG